MLFIGYCEAIIADVFAGVWAGKGIGEGCCGPFVVSVSMKGGRRKAPGHVFGIRVEDSSGGSLRVARVK